LYNHLLYLLYWVTNALVLFLASRILPEHVVLGTFRFTSVEAAIYAGFWMTFFVWSMWDYLLARGEKMEGLWRAVTYFWVVNTVGVWLTARFPYYTGLGISSYVWAMILGLVANMAQRIVWKILVTSKEKQ